jgi:hypothetical protein
MPFVLDQNRQAVEVDEETATEWSLKNYKEINSVYLLREDFTVDFHIITCFHTRTGEWICWVLDQNIPYWEDRDVDRESFPNEQIAQAVAHHEETVEFYRGLDR